MELRNCRKVYGRFVGFAFRCLFLSVERTPCALSYRLLVSETWWSHFCSDQLVDNTASKFKFCHRKTMARVLFFSVMSLLAVNLHAQPQTEEDLGVKYASRCEVCKVLALELQSRMEETGRSHDVIELGYSLDDVKPKKRTKYEKSELRLIESLDGVCERILEYNIHKERDDSTRFAKGMSQTFKTLHGLVDKGVKVDLGIPYDLWDKPSAEITNLKSQCESLLEENEEAIEDWYWHRQDQLNLKDHLCTRNALRGADTSCLDEDLKDSKGDLAKREPKSEL